MSKLIYRVHIYEPNSKTKWLTRYEALSPFVPFNVDDVIDPITWLGTRDTNESAVKVVSVRHDIYDIDQDLYHHVHVLTNACDDE